MTRASPTTRTTSRCSGAHSSPTAENTPARGGTTTARMPSASATAHACSGPAPPNATSARSRGSTPCSTRHHAHRAFHRRVHHRDHPVGRHPGAVERGARRGDVEAPEPGELGVGGDAPEHEVGVGHRRPRCRRARSTRVRDRRPRSPGRPRARRRRRGARTDPPPAPMVWIASAGSRIGKPADRARRGGLRHAALDQAHVGAGAAHVERDRVGEAARRARRRPRRARRPQDPRAASAPDARPRPTSGTSPPADVITSTSSASGADAARGTARHTGRSAASATVVTMRSYSRNSGDTSCEHTTSMPAGARATSATAALVGTHRDRRGAGTPRPRRRRRASGHDAVERLDSRHRCASSRPTPRTASARGTSGDGSVDVRVVERRAGLPRDLDHVGEAAVWPPARRGPARRSSSALVATVVPWASTLGARRSGMRRPPHGDGSAGRRRHLRRCDRRRRRRR